MDMHGNQEDVRFAFEAASRLEASLRAAAATLDGQRAERGSWALTASSEFRGRFAEMFAANNTTEARDAGELAATLRRAADQVQELARLAREEQDDREQARAWYHRQSHKNALDDVHDFIFGAEKPPIPTHSGPSSIVTVATSPRQR